MSYEITPIRAVVRTLISDSDSSDYKYTNDEIDLYVQASVWKINQKQYDTSYVYTAGSPPTLDNTPDARDLGLIAGVAAVLIDPAADISWSTGELSYRASKSSVGGEELIDRLIGQALDKDVDFILQTEGITSDLGVLPQRDFSDYIDKDE